MAETSSDFAGPRHALARLAGLMYLVVVVSGMFSLAWGPALVFAGASDDAILGSIRAHISLLRWMIVAEAACYVAFACLVVVLYRLLAHTDELVATLMAVLALISVPFGISNLGNLVEIVRSLESGDGVNETMLAALAHYNIGIFLQSIPWGLWLLPFGYLIIRCGFLPRAVGVLLILAGLGYAAHFVGRTVLPGYEESGLRQMFAAPRIGEILICLWLLVFGARRAVWPLHATAGSPEGSSR